MVDITQSLSINFADILSKASLFGKIVLYGLIVLVIGYFVRYYTKYKYPLHLYIQTGKGIRYKKDRGKKDKKEMKFVALKHKDIDFPYPETKYEYQYKKNSCLSAYIKNQSATWLEISDNPHFVPANYDMQSKMINDLKATWEIIKPEGNFWDKYGQQVLWISSLAIFLIVIILILKRMDSIIEMGKNIAVAQASQGKQVISTILPLPLLMRKRNGT